MKSNGERTELLMVKAVASAGDAEQSKWVYAAIPCGTKNHLKV